MTVIYREESQRFTVDNKIFWAMQNTLSPEEMRTTLEQGMKRSPSYWSSPPVITLFEACLDVLPPDALSYPDALINLLTDPSADPDHIRIIIQDIIPLIEVNNPTAANFLNRVLADYEAITHFPYYEQHKLTPLQPSISPLPVPMPLPD